MSDFSQIDTNPVIKLKQTFTQMYMFSKIQVRINSLLLLNTVASFKYDHTLIQGLKEGVARPMLNFLINRCCMKNRWELIKINDKTTSNVIYVFDKVSSTKIWGIKKWRIFIKTSNIHRQIFLIYWIKFPSTITVTICAAEAKNEVIYRNMHCIICRIKQIRRFAYTCSI